MPRWRLPGMLLFGTLVLGGCAAKKEAADGDSGLQVPYVKMALLKIPLNGHDEKDAIGLGSDPVQRFVPEPVQVAYKPAW